MGQHITHKSGYAGKITTRNRRAIRASKYAVLPLSADLLAHHTH
jgi:hypothetical protein